MSSGGTARPTRRRALAAVALCAAAYLYVFPHYPRINNPNENVRLYMTAALAEEGTYRIDTLRKRWGWVNDAAVRDGHYYSVKAPGTSFLGVPGYALYHRLAGEEFDRQTALWIVRVTATVLPTLIFMFFFYRWLGAHTRRPVLRDSVFLSVALGSLLLGYAYMFASHTTSAAAGFGAFMLLHDGRHRGHMSLGGAFVAGLLAAGCSLFEYPCLFASVFLCLYALTALRPWSRLAPFAAGALIPTLAMMHFQWRAFANPFTPGHLMVENPAFRKGHEEGFFGAQEFHWEAAWRLLFDFRLGLFALTPLLILALPGFARLVGRRDQRLDGTIALLICVSMYVFICFMNIWHAGWSIGPRYLAVIVPFMGWAALAALDAVGDMAPRMAGGVALGCTAASLVAAGIPSMYYPHLPPGIDWPMGDLFGLLIRHDYAPSNAGNLAGWYGSASMIPILLLGLFALGWAAWSWRRPRDRVLVLGGAAVVGALLLVPHFRAPPRDRRAKRSVAFITRTWHPEGHDRAARLRRRLEQGGDPSPAGYRRLAELYREEGRAREARAMTRRAQIGRAGHGR